MKALKTYEYEAIDGYYRALNYLSVGQLYLLDNPLLRRPLTIDDIKNRVVGHFGTVPNQNFIYAHLNRIIKKYDLNMIYISGPGHGGNALTSNSYLEGSFTNFYPSVTEDYEGMKKLFKMFSFPYGLSSHASCEVPGSIHEGGELGYSLIHAFGSVIDNPDLICACCVGDGEAETGPLATSWHLNKIINPKTDGIVLPILNLNGYKIGSPTIFGRMSNDSLYHFFVGCGYKPYLVSGYDSEYLHERMAKVLDMIVKDIKAIKKQGLTNEKIMYPMLILKMPKGYTGPKTVDNLLVEGTFRAHQVPLKVDRDNISNVKLLENWLRSYNPSELFDENGTLREKYRLFIPELSKCMSMNKVTNGALYKDLYLPDYRNYEIKITRKGTCKGSSMLNLSKYIKDVISLNKNNFLITCPDEALSNRLNHIFSVTNRKWNDTKYSYDEYLSYDGRIIDSFLSEHVCQGIMEGYTLTGRQGFICSYEAFMKVSSSMMCEHAKWIKMMKEVPFRKDIPSLNYILTSNVWEQDHNGYTHQNPGFINELINFKPSIARIYMPIDSNSLICMFNSILNTKNKINVIVASKHESFEYLTMDEAKELLDRGIITLKPYTNSIKDPDIILVSSGSVPTLEVICASKILKAYIKDIKIKVIVVGDLLKLRNKDEYTDKEFDNMFTLNHCIFAFHGYPSLIHDLLYDRNNKNIHVFGYNEEGSITTPFDIRVRNKIDRFHLVIESLKYLKGHTKEKEKLIDYCNKMINDNISYVKEYGKDLEEIAKEL